MRRIPVLAAALALLLLSTAAPAASQVYRLHIAGMVCRICAYSVEVRLKNVEGVQDVEIDVRRGTAIVTTAEGAALDEGQARRVIEGAGFRLEGFEEAPAASRNPAD